MVAVALMAVGAGGVVAGLALIWTPLAVIAGGVFLLVAGADLAGRPRGGYTGGPAQAGIPRPRSAGEAPR